MASLWQPTLTQIVRVLINDSCQPFTFDDCEIQKAILTAGLIVSQEISLDNTYVFDFNELDISPDPVEDNDTVAMALFSLKAACLLSINKLDTSASGDGVLVRDGDSVVDTKGRSGTFETLIKMGPCKLYSDLLEATKRNGSSIYGGVGKAIMSPISHSGLSTSQIGGWFCDIMRSRRC